MSCIQQICYKASAGHNVLTRPLYIVGNFIIRSSRRILAVGVTLFGSMLEVSKFPIVPFLETKWKLGLIVSSSCKNEIQYVLDLTAKVNALYNRMTTLRY